MNKSNIIKKMRDPKSLTPDQRCHLVYGFSLKKKFPFVDQDDRLRLWYQYRNELLSDIDIPFKERIGFIHLLWDDLRPAAYYDFECPEFYDRKILNDAKRTGFRMYDKAPVLESEYDFLLRKGLLTKRDEEVMEEIEKQKIQGSAAPLLS